MEAEIIFTYLDLEESDGTKHHKMKVGTKKEYKRKIKLVLKSQLSARKKIASINSLAVPVVTYNYRVICWKLDEIQGLDKLTKKQLCMNSTHVMKGDGDRIYLAYQKVKED